MSQYNASHNKDLTAFKAIKNIERKIRRSALALCKMLFGMARIAGFDIVSSITLKHKRTGTELDITQEGEVHDKP